MHILDVTESVSRLGGGMFESVRHLAKSVRARMEAEVAVVGLADAMTEEDIGQWAPLAVSAHRILGPRRFSFSPGLTRAIKQAAPELIHLHGLWRYTSVVVWRWAKESGKPYIVSPHGMIEPWCLKQGRFRKRLALWFYQAACLRNAACIRATSVLEAESIRRAGFDAPVAVVPNGVVCPRDLSLKLKNGGAARRALFVSRLHPKKGLLNLVEAWSRVRPTGWELVIAGPDEQGHRAIVEAAVKARGLEREIVFQDEVRDEARTRLYLDSELFVLPSFSENFGLVIGEALGHGIPVITTRATPWEELEQYRCGWWSEVGVEPLVRALGEAVCLAPGVLKEMGGRGRALVQRRYSWERIGKEMAEVYEWMVGGRDRPRCLIVRAPRNTPRNTQNTRKRETEFWRV